MELFSYNQKICVVTGASSQIGLSIIKKLVDDGAIVYTLDLKRINLNGVISIYCDFSQKESIDHAFQEIPDVIDCFFGIHLVAGLHHDYYSTLTINYFAYKYITENYLRYRMNQGSSISFLSSMAGIHYEEYLSEYKDFIYSNTWEDEIKTLHQFIENYPVGVSAFVLSCRILNYYTKYISTSLGNDGIRVNSILPAIQNDITKIDESLLQMGHSSRNYHPDEVSNLFLYLNSDAASYISGECIFLDYGESALLLLGKKHNFFQMKTKSKLFHLNSISSTSIQELDKKMNQEII